MGLHLSHRQLFDRPLVSALQTATLSDATAGGLEVGSITFPISQDLVDAWHSIPEDEIAGKGRWTRARASLPADCVDIYNPNSSYC